MPKIDPEVIEAKLTEYTNALDRFEEALSLPKDHTLSYLDTSAHRFMLCFEVTWKNLRRILRLRGIQTNSPVSTFREAYQEQLIDNKEIFKAMIEDRNLVTHEYFQIQAEEIYKKLPNYLQVMRKTYQTIENLYRNHAIEL